jgi:hypothetical protein
MENIEENFEKIWKLWKKDKLNSEKIWKMRKKIVKWYGKYGWNVKWYAKYGRKVRWKVKRYGKYGGKVSWIVKRYGKFGKRQVEWWNDMENMEDFGVSHNYT